MSKPQARSGSFVQVGYPEPHRERTRRLLAAHPEVRQLCGSSRTSALLLAGGVVAQLGVAWLLRDQPWWLLLLAAYAVGAFLVHAMWVLIHEATHNLIFESTPANEVAAIVANLPIIFPGAIAFRRYHLLHHAYQGRMDLDADLPSPWEARLVGNSSARKALWMLFFWVFQALRVRRLDRVRLFDAWYVANIAVQAGFVAGTVLVAGWGALLYLGLASMFAIGLHPLGARWIQEHYLTYPGRQETFSYYGPLNAVALNVGYHNEHHDLMRVAWHRLPMLKQMAPEFYEGLHCHRSWTKLMLKFVFDPSLSLYSRAIRGPLPGQRPVGDGELAPAGERAAVG